MANKSQECVFQNDIIAQMVANGWLLGSPAGYNRELRTLDTIGVLRHELRDRGTRFKLCQFKPEHDPSKLRQQDLVMETGPGYGVTPGNEIGYAKAKDKKEEFLSRILARLNELFITDGLSDADLTSR